MASSGKKKTTFAKLARESKLRERRLDKAARKDARKRAASAPPAEFGEHGEHGELGDHDELGGTSELGDHDELGGQAEPHPEEKSADGVAGPGASASR